MFKNQKFAIPWEYIKSGDFKGVVHSLGFDIDDRAKGCLASGRFGYFFDGLGCGLDNIIGSQILQGLL